MQRLILIILSSFFLILSCHRSKPKGTLSVGTMVDLMTDIHLVDGYLNTLPIDSSRKFIDGLYGEVFKKYDIDSVAFKRNVAYYMGNTMVSKDLYTQVTKRIQSYEDDYRRADSVQNVRVSDSIRVVQRYERMKEAARRLILDVHPDTIPLSYRSHQKDFMESAGLYAIQPYQPLLQPDSTVSETKKLATDSLKLDSTKMMEIEAPAPVSSVDSNAQKASLSRPASLNKIRPRQLEAKTLQNE